MKLIKLHLLTRRFNRSRKGNRFYQTFNQNKKHYILLCLCTSAYVRMKVNRHWDTSLCKYWREAQTLMKASKMILKSPLSVILNVTLYHCALKCKLVFYDSAITFATGCFTQPFKTHYLLSTEQKRKQIIPFISICFVIITVIFLWWGDIFHGNLCNTCGILSFCQLVKPFRSIG